MESTAITTIDAGTGTIVGRVFATGGVQALTAVERKSYYRWECQRLGLDPYSFPLDYVKGQDDRLILFPNQRATDQLRKNRNLSIRVVSHEISEDLAIVTACCTDADGRTTEAIGTAELMDKYDKPLKGKARAQAIEKADTRARRRATLAACGLSSEDFGQVISGEIHDRAIE